MAASVLVVDDEELVRSLLVRMLGILGCKVVAVADAESALQVLAAPRFDLILADVILSDEASTCLMCRSCRSPFNLMR